MEGSIVRESSVHGVGLDVVRQRDAEVGVRVALARGLMDALHGRGTHRGQVQPGVMVTQGLQGRHHEGTRRTTGSTRAQGESAHERAAAQLKKQQILRGRGGPSD